MCSPGGAGHGIGGITGDLDSLGDVADSQDPIQRLGFKYFHVLGSPLFELFIAWTPPPGPTTIVPVGVGNPFSMPQLIGPVGSCSEMVCPCAKRDEGGGVLVKGFWLHYLQA